MSNDLKTKSRFLSMVLRHDPGAIGLSLDAQGWADIPELVAKATIPLSYDDVLNTVRTSDKQRFALSHDNTRIRANQGHSVSVDLGLVA